MLSRATDVEAVVSFFPEKYNDHKFLRCGRTAAFKRDPLYQLQQTVAFSKPEGVDVAQWREALRVRWDDVALPEASSTEQERAWFNRVARDIFTDCYRQFGFEPRVRGLRAKGSLPKFNAQGSTVSKPEQEGTFRQR